MSRYLHNEGDCHGTRCTYCGCCMHSAGPCKVNDAPRGMACPSGGCGCEGQS